MSPTRLANLDLTRKPDVQLLVRAASRGWPVPNAIRRRAARALMAVINDPRSTDLDRVSACRAIVSLNAANLKEARQERPLAERD
jgi:hypothetical protein